MPRKARTDRLGPELSKVANHTKSQPGTLSEAPAQIVILGMHRSGTSALAGALHAMGAFVGEPDAMTGKNWENPLGFFERRDTRVICDAILHGNHADWWKVANFDADRVPYTFAHARQAEFSAVISRLDEGAGKNGVWALKEPRFCVLFPILRRALVNPHVVIMTRNPLEVAKSLRRRNGFTMDAGLALWEAYMVSAIQASGSSNPILVSYDRLVSDPEQTLERLAGDLAARGVSGLDAKAGAGAVLASLRREAVEDDVSKEQLTPSQARLWKALQADTLPEGPVRLSDEAHETLLDFESDETAKKLLEAEVRSLRQTHKAADSLAAELKTANTRAEHLANDVEATSARLEEVKRQLAQATEHNETLTSLAQSLEIRLQRESEIARRAEDLQNQLDAARGDLTRSTTEVESLRKHNKALEARAQGYETNLAESRARIEQLREESTSMRERFRSSLRWRIGDAILAPLVPIRSIRRQLTIRKHRSDKLLIQASGLFDAHLYAEKNPDIRDSGMPPLDHFLITGWREGREIGKAFSPRAYLAAYPDVAALGANPLLHYIKHGRAEGRLPVPEAGSAEALGGDTYALVKASGLFDEPFYLSHYPDVKAAGMDALEHFLCAGWAEGRDPGPAFSCRAYLEHSPDVAAAHINPLVHYLTNGKSEGRAILAPDDYKASSPSSNMLSSSPPDLFAFRAARRTSKRLVIFTAPDRDAIDRLRASVQAAPLNADIVVLHPNSIATPRPAVSATEESSLFVLGYPPSFLSAKAVINLINHGPVTDYEQVVWVRAVTPSPLESEEIRSRLATCLSEGFDLRALAADTFDVVETENHLAVRRALSTYFFRLGRMLKRDRLDVPGGDIISLPALICHQIRAYHIKAHELQAGEEADSILTALISAIAEEADLSTVPLHQEVLPALASGDGRTVKAIAFYLPQFHPIEENSRWWGKGFTEWTNVTKARPLFRWHHQPQLPADLGFYDLRLPQAQLAQANLAHDYGLHGFCYYYYWFDGKKVLNEPIEQMLDSGSPNFPFCVCWANENWSRNWDGQNKHVLLEQHYSRDSNLELIHEFIKLMRDDRYIRHNGKPVLLVYRIRIIPNWLETAQMWRDECRKAGIGEIHLCAVRFGLEPLDGQPAEFGLDSFVLFPPHESEKVDVRSSVRDLAPDFNGTIFDYDSAMEMDLERFDKGYPWPVHRGVMLGWDNTARRPRDSRIFLGSTPARLHRWLKAIAAQEDQHNENTESLVFINAWNEWAEGTNLEPSAKFGRGYLQALRSALGPLVEKTERPSPIVAESILPLEQASMITAQWFEGARPRKPDAPSVLVCAHVVSHHLFGAERSFLDVLDALAELNINIIVALPTDVHAFYTRLCQERSCGVAVLPYRQWRDNRAPEGDIVDAFETLIDAQRIDAVYANTIVLLEPLIAARAAGCKTLVHARELVDRDEGLVAQIGLDPEAIVRKVESLADGIVANSFETERLFGKHENRFCVPNVIDPDDLDMANTVGDKVKFVMASSNIPKKGLDDFIAVARACEQSVPNAEFVLVGPENSHLKAARIDAPGNIVFAGYANSPAHAMGQGNVVLSLSQFAESFGRTVAEGQAARRPVIAYDWGAVPELIAHGETGFLAPYRDVEAVCTYVKLICENPDMISRMGEAGRARMLASYTPPALVNGLWRALESTLNQPIGRHRAPRSVTVIIPVFNAYEATRACLEALKTHTDPAEAVRIVMLNDASTDPRMAPLLDTFAQLPGFHFLTNPVNKGYTTTINAGIEWAEGDDVVLLNSDAVVTGGWLAGLARAAYSGTKVATATAMSDNAGAFSFPVQDAPNPKPEDKSFDEFAGTIIAHTSRLSPVDVPTGSGFCMYIRRDALNVIGLFDAEAFPRGYGEENDFCMRAIMSGWRNVISPYAYVFHVRSASFGKEKDILIKGAVDTVTKRYPQYARLVKESFGSKEMQDLRQASRTATTQP